MHVDWARVLIVAAILAAAISVNVTVNLKFPEISDRFPFLGVAVWVALLATSALRTPEWSLLPEAFKGSVFLLSLVLCASMMPVEELPLASWQTALGLGFVSSVFDNIPLTALALKQGGYDWGFLAYAVGFGGSMIWFGSSAGVALSNSVSRGQVGRAMAASWLVCRRGLCDRLLRHAGGRRLGATCTPQRCDAADPGRGHAAGQRRALAGGALIDLGQHPAAPVGLA